MPTLNDRIAFGVDQKDADAAKSQIIRWVEAFEPEYLRDSFDTPFKSIPLEMKGIVLSYLEHGDKTPLADILRISKEGVDKDSLSKISTIIYVKTKKKPYITSVTEGKALTILARGGLSYDNGLPAVGNPPVTPKLLESGYAMHLSAGERQTFKGEGGRCALLMLWK
ncbi:hypothetical protein N7G274_010800 [Stereocaulon virgatum]|uniref:Uncharacterized protein n=1 Tax=Stereocaulon virgatum TaxID=373712 RepID=A0ABR3ZVF5_9LECA